MAARRAALALYRRRYDYELAADLLGTVHEIGLNGDDPRIRSLALRALGQSAALEYLDPLREALGTDPDPDVRLAAMSALSEHRDGRPNPDPAVYNDLLIESLRRDPDPRVRMSAASWLRSAVELADVRAAMSAALAAETDASVRAMIESVIEPPAPRPPGGPETSDSAQPRAGRAVSLRADAGNTPAVR